MIEHDLTRISCINFTFTMNLSLGFKRPKRRGRGIATPTFKDVITTLLFRGRYVIYSRIVSMLLAPFTAKISAHSLASGHLPNAKGGAQISQVADPYELTRGASYDLVRKHSS